MQFFYHYFYVTIQPLQAKIKRYIYRTMPFHHISTNFSREKCPFVHNYLWFLQYISDLDIFRIIYCIYNIHSYIVLPKLEIDLFLRRLCNYHDEHMNWFAFNFGNLTTIADPWYFW